MKLSMYLDVHTVDNKAISLAAQRTNVAIKVFGGTMPMSAQRTDDYGKLSQVTIYPEQGKDGVVAVAVVSTSWDSKGRSHSDFIPAFLKVVWKENKEGQKFPFVDRDEPWIPAERIGQVTHEAVEVMLKNGKRFSSYDNFKYNTSKDKDLPRFVPDGDLLCRYLWGTASAADVLHAAVQEKLEPLAKQLVGQLTNEICGLVGEKNAKEAELLATNRNLIRMYGKLEREYEELVNYLDMSEGFYRLLKRFAVPWFLKGFVGAMDCMHWVRESRDS